MKASVLLALLEINQHTKIHPTKLKTLAVTRSTTQKGGQATSFEKFGEKKLQVSLALQDKHMLTNFHRVISKLWPPDC